MVLRPVRCVIYDLDGVLLDTEPLYTQATQEIVGRFGKTFDWQLKRHMIGRPAIESARFLVQALDLPISAQEYLRQRQRRLEKLFREAQPMPGAERFTRTLARLGVRQAVATSSERRLLDCKLSRHRKWFEVFEVLVTGDDPRVRRGKPAPDIFLVAARALGAEPGECLVVEDSPAGVAAAKAAGMQAVAMPDPALDTGLFAGADRVIAGFDELDPMELVPATELSSDEHDMNG